MILFRKPPRPEPDDVPVSSLQKMIGLAIVTAFLWILWGPGSPLAGRGEPSARPDGPPPVPAPRVASTSPAITDTLVDLGLVEHLVGRSAYCTGVPAAMPVVGDLRSFDAERLALVDPDILFVQPPLAGVDPALAAHCEKLGIAIVAQRLDSLADLSTLVAAIGAAMPEAGLEAARADRLEARVAEARRTIAGTDLVAGGAADDDPGAAEGRGTPAVLLLLAADPFLVAGAGGYLDELLRRGGARNASSAEGYAELAAEAVVALAPEVVVGVVASADGAARMREAIAALPWPEGRAPRVAVAAEPALLAPSLRAVARGSRLADLVREAR